MSFTRPFEHREALRRAALAEFTAVGYEQASINTILKNAGMSKGQFYYHFGNKEGLYLSLVEMLIAQKRAFMAAVMQPEDFDQDIFGIFQTQIAYGLAFAREHPYISAFSDSFLKEKGTPIYDKVMATFNFDDDATINTLIRQAHENGQFREDLPLSFIQKTVGYLFTHATDLTNLSSTEDAPEHLAYLVTFMRSGLARRT